MTVKQKRAFAYVLAGCAIVVSAFLWAEITRSHTAGNQQASVAFTALAPPRGRGAPVLAFTNAVPPSALHPASSTEAAPVSDSEPKSAGVPVLTEAVRRPLLPSLHFPSSAVSSRVRSDGDDRARAEMAQWEIREAYGLAIPGLGIRAPVFLPSSLYWDKRDWDGLERQMQVGLLSGLVAYPHSAAPDKKGTIIIAGHSSPPSDRAKESRYGRIFMKLPDLKPNDTIILYNGSTPITYEVMQTRIVPAGDTGILAQQGAEEVLKLITCYPVGSVKERLVVSAKRVGSRSE